MTWRSRQQSPILQPRKRLSTPQTQQARIDRASTAITHMERAGCMRSWLTQRSSRDARLVYRLPHTVASPKPALPSISVSKPSPVRRASQPRSGPQLVGVGLPTLAVTVHKKKLL